MRPPVRRREDYEARHLRALAKASRDAHQTRRLLALARIYDAGSRREAAKTGGVGVRTVRDWVLAFNAEGPLGLIDSKAAGNRPVLKAEQREALERIVEAGPNPAVDGVVRAMGYRKLCARPRHHAQDPAAREAFKKTSPRLWKKSRSMTRSARL
jgi:transposase